MEKQKTFIIIAIFISFAPIANIIFQAKADNSALINSLPNIIAHYTFDETEGIIAFNSTENDIDLEWGYNPYATSRTIPEKTAGKIGLGVRFRQYEEWFRKELSPAIDFSDGLTTGMWIKTDLVQSYPSRFYWIGNTLSATGWKPENVFVLYISDGFVYVDMWKDGELILGFVTSLRD